MKSISLRTEEIKRKEQQESEKYAKMHAIMEDIGPNHSDDRVWQTQVAEFNKTTITYRHPSIPRDDEDDEEDILGPGSDGGTDGSHDSNADES